MSIDIFNVKREEQGARPVIDGQKKRPIA